MFIPNQEKVKDGLTACINRRCPTCRYQGHGCVELLERDALDLINAMDKELTDLFHGIRALRDAMQEAK